MVAVGDSGTVIRSTTDGASWAAVTGGSNPAGTGGSARIADLYSLTEEQLEASGIDDDGDSDLTEEDLDRWAKIASAAVRVFDLDIAAVKRGVALVAARYGWILRGIVDGDADVEAVDVFMQLALFGECRYG